MKGRGEGDFSSKKVAVVNSLIRFQRKSGARAFSAVWMGFGDRQRAEPEPAIFIFRRSNTTLPPPLSSLIVCVPCIYTRVYTPVSFILIPLHLETRHGAAQQPRVGNAPFCPATTTTRPKPPSPQPTRHCNFVQSYFDVSLTLSPLANLKSPSILPGLPLIHSLVIQPPPVWLQLSYSKSRRCYSFAVLRLAPFYSFSHCSSCESWRF